MKITRAQAERIARTHDLNLDSGMTAPEARKAKAERADKARKLIDGARSRGGDMTPPEERDFDKLMAEADDLGALADYIEGEQGGRGFEGDTRNTGTTDSVWFTNDRGQRMRGVGHGESFARLVGGRPRSDGGEHNGPDGGHEEHSLGRALMAMLTGERDIAEREFRDQVISQDPSGGMFITPALSGRFIDLARANSVLSLAGAISLPLSDAETRIVRVDTDPTAAWKGELKALNNTDVKFGAITLYPKVMGAVVDISEELVQDGRNAPEVIESVLAQAVANQLDRSLFRGIDSEFPGRYFHGVLDDPDVNVVDVGTNGVAPSAAIGYDWYVDAAQKVEDANGPTTVRIDSPRTAASFAKLKDANNQPLNAPADVSRLRHIRSTQVPVDMTHGTANNASAAVVGDFRSAFVVLGVRSAFRVEVSREAGNAWENLGRKVRVWGRADLAIGRPKHLTVVKGILP